MQHVERQIHTRSGEHPSGLALREERKAVPPKPVRRPESLCEQHVTAETLHAAVAGAALLPIPRGQLAYPRRPASGRAWSRMCTSTRARHASGSAVSVPADLSDRYVTAFSVRSYVSRAKATGCRAQDRASQMAEARSSSGTKTAHLEPGVRPFRHSGGLLAVLRAVRARYDFDLVRFALHHAQSYTNCR